MQKCSVEVGSYTKNHATDSKEVAYHKETATVM